jgi:hypothetical protein
MYEFFEIFFLEHEKSIKYFLGADIIQSLIG